MKRIFLHLLLLLTLTVNLFSNNTKKVTYPDFSNSVSVLLNDIVTQDTFIIQVSDCMDSVAVCIDIDLADIADYSFMNNGVMYLGDFTACSDNSNVTNSYDYAQLFGQGNLGPYMLDAWTVGSTTFSGTFANIPDLVDSLNFWDPTGSWILDVTNQKINGGTSGVTYSDMDVTVISISAPSSIPLNTISATNGTALRLPSGTHMIQVIDNATGGTCVDSFLVMIACVQPNVEVFELMLDSVHLFCMDQSELFGLPVSTEILCPSNNSTAANFNLVNLNTCLEISGMSLGQDTACYVICDTYGICDTTTIYVNIIPSPSSIIWISDTIYSNATMQICIDTFDLDGTVDTIFNGCPSQSGEFVSFEIDTNTYCVTYGAIDLGQDTACIYVVDDLGNIDTTYLVVEVANPTPDTMIQNIVLGNVGMFCIDSTQLGGTVSIVENFCGGIGDVAIFSSSSQALCYDVTTLAVGQDTACIAVCDNFAVCDTTILIANVTAPQVNNLMANDDAVTTDNGIALTINICENDTIPNGLLTNYYILPPTFGGLGPNYGMASFDIDNECNLIYTPNGTECDVVDSFKYVICNVQGCDTAMVTVFIDCGVPEGQVKIMSGFSPNGDEVNQYFMVKGAESFPNNELQVFNRWGNLVYEGKNYQNDWAGTWNGSSLQNGTYFYVFSDGEGNTYSGYVFLQK